MIKQQETDRVCQKNSIVLRWTWNYRLHPAEYGDIFNNTSGKQDSKRFSLVATAAAAWLKNAAGLHMTCSSLVRKYIKTT